MTETDTATDRSSLVPGVHRLIRIVDGSEGPFAGALVGYEDSVAVCVDAGELANWGGWAFSDAEHVCGVIDLRRRADGQDALLPWCTQHVETFLGRRLAAEEPLAAGEITTLVISLLRGVQELGSDDAATAGEWWLTGEGRPLFVHGAGGGARPRTGALIERVRPHTSDRATLRALDEMVTALRDHRHHRDDDARWEEQLLMTAAPRALRLDVFAPERAADLAPHRLARGVLPAGAQQTRRMRRSQNPPSAIAGMLEAVRSTVRERAESMLARRRPTRPSRPKSSSHGADAGESTTRRPRVRKRAWMLAGSLAGMVLIAGLMWPDGSDPEPANAVQIAESTNPDDTATAPAGEEPADTGSIDSTETPESGSEAPTDAASADDDPLPVVPALLEAIANCIENTSGSCPEALAGGLGLPADGLVVQGPSGSSAELVDDYGDVAVVKLTPVEATADMAAQMLVMERGEQNWLVRDVYDVAHQPSGE